MKFFLFVIFILFLIIKYSESIECKMESKNTEMRLKKSILCTYDKTVRPVNHHLKATSVSMKYSVKSFKFNEWYQEPKLIINLWMHLSWNDNHLVWNSNEYDNIEIIGISSDNIWMPQMTVLNAELKGKSICHQSNCKVKYDGNVTCIQPCTHYSLCRTDFKRWPYDRQECLLQIGSWTETQHMVNYSKHTYISSPDEIPLKNVYRLVATTTEYVIEEVMTDCCGLRKFPLLLFTFLFERYSKFYGTIILVPSLVLVFINLICLWLEPGCTDRLSLNGLSLFSNFILFKSFSWMIPKNGSENPSIITFALYSIGISVVLLLNTVITRSITRFQRKVPPKIIYTTNFFTTNIIVGRYFNADNFIDKINNSTSKNGDPAWNILAKFIDRIIFIIVLVFYIIIFCTMFPTGYANLLLPSD